MGAGEMTDLMRGCVVERPRAVQRDLSGKVQGPELAIAHVRERSQPRSDMGASWLAEPRAAGIPTIPEEASKSS